MRGDSDDNRKQETKETPTKRLRDMPMDIIWHHKYGRNEKNPDLDDNVLARARYLTASERFAGEDFKQPKKRSSPESKHVFRLEESILSNNHDAYDTSEAK